MSAPTLFDCLATVPDARSRHGVRHPLSAILGMVVLAALLGRTSLAGIARLGRQYGPRLAFALGFTRGKTPSLSTLSRTLSALDAAAVEAALSRWVSARLAPADREHISLDGKTVRGPGPGRCRPSTCWPPTPRTPTRSSPRCGWTPPPTSTRRPSTCSACSR